MMISLIMKETHHVENLENVYKIPLKQASVVLIHAAHNSHFQVRRCGTSVKIKHEQQPEITLQHFYDPLQPTDHSLVFMDAAGHCTWLRFTNDFGHFYPKPIAQKIDCYSELLYLFDADSDALMFKHNTTEFDYAELSHYADINLSDLELAYNRNSA